MAKPLAPRYVLIHVQNSAVFSRSLTNWDDPLYSSTNQPDLFHMPFSQPHTPFSIIIQIDGELSPNILDKARQSYANSLQSKILSDEGALIWKAFEPVGCNPITEGYHALPRFCLYEILHHKYNLTTLHASKINPNRRHDVVGTIVFDVAVVYNSEYYNLFAIYRVEFVQFFFQVTTQNPNMYIGSSFASLFSPFDFVTWLFILFTCLAISLFSSWGNTKPSRVTNFIHFVTQFIAMISILLGQFGPGLGRIFTTKYTVPLFLTFYFFGSYILMENLYKGYIFAGLTVQSTPHVPDTFPALVDSNIPVISYHRFARGVRLPSRQRPCVLSHKIIPEILPNIDSKFAGILAKFNLG